MCHNRNHGPSYVAASCWDDGTQSSSEVFCGCTATTRSSSRQTGHMRANSLLWQLGTASKGVKSSHIAQLTTSMSWEPCRVKTALPQPVHLDSILLAGSPSRLAFVSSSLRSLEPPAGLHARAPPPDGPPTVAALLALGRSLKPYSPISDLHSHSGTLSSVPATAW